MLHITEEMINKVKKLEELNSYISIVVDYEKEAEFADSYANLHDAIESLNPEFTPGDRNSILGAVESYTKELYLYTYSEILDIFYCGNSMLSSAIEWIDAKNRVNYLLLNGKLADNAYLNDLLVNINDNYIASPIKLERSSANLQKEEYHLLTA